jgi:hypothetical protein
MLLCCSFPSASTFKFTDSSFKNIIKIVLQIVEIASVVVCILHTLVRYSCQDEYKQVILEACNNGYLLTITSPMFTLFSEMNFLFVFFKFQGRELLNEAFKHFVEK